MLNFVVKSEILKRFSRLKTIRLEIFNCKKFIIGSNDFVCSIQYLGETKEPNEVVFLNFTEKMLETLDVENYVGSDYIVETNPETAKGSIKTTMGTDCSEMLCWKDFDETDNWRKWIRLSEKTNGFMYWDLYQVQTLFECSPSGKITFPEKINSSEPVILRDINCSDWLGIFIPESGDTKYVKPARLPEWINANNA